MKKVFAILTLIICIAAGPGISFAGDCDNCNDYDYNNDYSHEYLSPGPHNNDEVNTLSSTTSETGPGGPPAYIDENGNLVVISGDDYPNAVQADVLGLCDDGQLASFGFCDCPY